MTQKIRPKGISTLTAILLMIITALSVAVVMLYLQNNNAALPFGGKAAAVAGPAEEPIEAEPAVTNVAVSAESAAEENTPASAAASASAEEEEKEAAPVEEKTPPVDPIKSCVTIKTISGTGSGFVTQKGEDLYVATCAHVVYEEPMLAIRDLEGHTLKAEEVLVAKDRDLAFVKIIKPEHPVYPLAVHDNVTSLTKLPEVVCYGDSEGVGVIVKCEGKMLGIGPLNIETDTPFVSGNSGGPVLLKDTNLVVAVAACLTRRSEGNKWAKGTRFENETRRFSVRFDNLKTEDLEKTEWGKIDEKDAGALNKFAEEAEKKGDEETFYKIVFYNAGLKDTWALNKCCEILLAELASKTDKEEFEEEQYKTFKTFQNAAENKIPGGLFGSGLCYLYGIGTTTNTEEGFKKIEEAARSGYSAAQYFEGYCYQTGTGTDINLEKAFSSYKKAADQGHLKALNALGDCYHYGWGTTQNDKLAKDCFQKAADQNDAEGQWNMGLCYEYGIAVPEDMEKAFSYYRKAAEQGDVSSCVKLAHIYSEKEDFKSAAILYRKAADQNDPTAIYSLSLFYKLGIGGLPKDNEIEVALVKKAADMEDENAMIAMGGFYRFGYASIIPKDTKEAALWFAKAAHKGSALAKDYIGVMYENGEYYERNYTKAFQYYKESAEAGCEAAWANLGVCYLYGNGTERNLSQGVYWIAKAASAGIAVAQVTYAQCYFNGWGVPMNYQSAFYWYEKAAREGENAEAMASLGAMYEKGWGVPKADYQKAAEWYAKGVQKGDATSAFLLGNLYYYGIGVTRDYNYAKKLFQYAWEEGKNENAYKMMQQCP